MKNFISIALLIPIVIGIMVVSCKAKETKDYMIFSGKITNHNKKIKGMLLLPKVYRDLSKSQYAIQINEDGSFLNNLQIETGYYVINLSTKIATIYLNKINDLKLFFNENDFIHTNYINLKFEGKDAAINTYLQKKSEILLASSPKEWDAIILLEENEFVTKYKNQKFKLENILKESGIKNEYFLKLEFKNIYYKYFFAMQTYNIDHGKAINNPDFKISDSFPYNQKLMEDFDFNDFIAYEKIPEYFPLIRNILSSLFVDEKYKYDKKTSNKNILEQDYIDIINTKVTNKIIKNELIYQEIKLLVCIMGQKIEDEYYKKIMINITNEDYKKEIKKNYENQK